MTRWEWALQTGAWPTAALWAVALMWAVLCCGVMVMTDLREHRLPNRWTARLAAGGAVGVAGGAALGGRWDVAAEAVLGGVVYAAGMLALHVLSRGGLGMGDVKLAGGLGMHVAGWGGLGSVLLAAVGAILLGGLVALMLVLLRRADRRAALPFGPPMVVAATLVTVGC